MPRGRGSGGFAGLYGYSYWWRCRWFPWLPRWWWVVIYGPVTPLTPYGAMIIPKEQEIAMLEGQRKLLEQIRKRLEELKKTGE